MIDLGFAGDVYVVGLTLEEVEHKIAQQLTVAAHATESEDDEPYRVSVRLANVQSKYYYVMGTVATQGRFPIKGNETVLDAILQAGLKSNSLPEKSYLVRPHPARRARPGLQDRLVRHQGAGRHAHQLPAFPRRPDRRPGHKAARPDRHATREQ